MPRVGLMQEILNWLGKVLNKISLEPLKFRCAVETYREESVKTFKFLIEKVENGTNFLQKIIRMQSDWLSLCMFVSKRFIRSVKNPHNE